jgi:hypothetical protein
MHNIIKPPTFDELASPHYDEFSGAASEHFTQVDPDDVLECITHEDLQNARWNPAGGFLVLMHPYSPKDRTQGQFRIHVWPRGIDRTDAEPHWHPWHLASLVQGEVDSEYVEQLVTTALVEEGEDADFEAFKSQHNPANVNEIRLTSMGLVKAKFSDQYTYGRGQVHMLPSGEYHFTPVSDDRLLVTAALMGPTLHAASNLKKVNSNVGSIEPPRQQLADIDKVWRQILEAREQSS